MSEVIINVVSFLIPLTIIGYFVFWVAMLVHAIRHPPKYHNVAWVLVILFVPFFGAIIYAMLRERHDDNSPPQPPPRQFGKWEYPPKS
jgi:putative effector of murein hydrolase LrgA (UPF0299 family)